MTHRFCVYNNINKIKMEKEKITLEEAEKTIRFVTENGYDVKGFIGCLGLIYEQIAEAYIQLEGDAPSGTCDVLNSLYTIKNMKRKLESLL